MDVGIASRIKSVREAKKLSVRGFASLLGTSAPTISRVENSQRSPDLNLILKIATTFKCNLDWLMKGVSPDSRAVPVSSGRIPIFRDLPDDLKNPSIALIDAWLDLPGLPSSAAAIYCQDDSASPILRRGDLIIFVPVECNAGDLALLVDQWGARVRRVKSGSSGLTYHAENPEYRDQDERAEYKQIGKVIKIVRDVS